MQAIENREGNHALITWYEVRNQVISLKFWFWDDLPGIENITSSIKLFSGKFGKFFKWGYGIIVTWVNLN